MNVLKNWIFFNSPDTAWYAVIPLYFEQTDAKFFMVILESKQNLVNLKRHGRDGSCSRDKGYFYHVFFIFRLGKYKFHRIFIIMCLFHYFTVVVIILVRPRCLLPCTNKLITNTPQILYFNQFTVWISHTQEFHFKQIINPPKTQL